MIFYYTIWTYIVEIYLGDLTLHPQVRSILMYFDCKDIHGFAIPGLVG